MTRYTFDEVQRALKAEWGLTLQRGEASKAADAHDGRWDVTQAKTGFVVGGSFPGHKHSYRHYRSLAQIVRACELAKPIQERRRG
jgi:hypothetical protein